MSIDLHDRKTRTAVLLGFLFLGGMGLALTQSRNPIVVIAGGFAGVIAYFVVQITKRSCPSCGHRLTTRNSGPTNCPSCSWSGYP